VVDTIAVVGATGAVGRIIVSLLLERQFPARRVKLLASSRSAGRPLEIGGGRFDVEVTTPEAFEGVDIAIGSTPDEVAREFVPQAVERGAVVVDESAAFRMQQGVPLVIPEVNPEAIADHRGIIASPNCSTTQMVMALKPLHDAAGVRRVVVSTYQAVSGAGLAASRELLEGMRAVLSGDPEPRSVFPHPIVGNLIPQIGSRSGFSPPASACRWSPPTANRSLSRPIASSPPRRPAGCLPRHPESSSTTTSLPAATPRPAPPRAAMR